MELILLVLLAVFAAVQVRRAMRLPWQRPFLRAARDWLLGVGGATAAMFLLSGTVAGVVMVLSLTAGAASAVRTAGREAWRLLRDRRALLNRSEDPDERRRILVDELDAMEARRGRPEGSGAEAVAIVAGGATAVVGLALADPVVFGLGAAVLSLPVQTAARWLGEGAAYRRLRERALSSGRRTAELPPEGGAGEAPSPDAAAPSPPEIGSGAVAPGADPSPLAARGVGGGVPLQGIEGLVLRRTAPGQREYELVAEGTVVGELVGASRKGFTAAGECLGEAWDIEIQRRFLSIWSVDARLVRSGSDEEGLSFRGRSWRSGQVVTAEGARYRWEPRLFGMSSSTQLCAVSGEPLLRYRAPFVPLLRSTTHIAVEPQAWELAELPRLVLLTACLRLHMDAPWHRPFRRPG